MVGMNSNHAWNEFNLGMISYSNGWNEFKPCLEWIQSRNDFIVQRLEWIQTMLGMNSIWGPDKNNQKKMALLQWLKMNMQKEGERLQH